MTYFTLLEIILDKNLSFSEQGTTRVSKSSQTSYALKTLEFHGLLLVSLDAVCKSTLVDLHTESYVSMVHQQEEPYLHMVLSAGGVHLPVTTANASSGITACK